MRAPVVAAVALALLLGGSLVAVWYVTRDPPPPVAPGTGSTSIGAPLPEGPIDMARAPPGGFALPPQLIVKDEPPPPPDPGSWEAIPITVLRGRATFGLPMEELQPQLSQCYEARAQNRYAGHRIEQVKDFAPLQNDTDTILVLQVESTATEIRVVDAPVETRGGASDATLACAQAVFRGLKVAPGALDAGRKYRFRFVLTQ